VYSFDRLSAEQRPRVVRDGLRAGGSVGKLYAGAIYLTQIAFYAGVYDPAAGCALIEFEGENGGFDLAKQTYPVPGRFLPHALSVDGNPA